MSVELNEIKSGYSTGLINANFQEIANLLNNNFLQRDGLEAGDPNQMELDLDMNGNEILNVAVGTSAGSLVNKGYVDAGDAANSAETAAEAAIRAAQYQSLLDMVYEEISNRIAGDNQLRTEYSAGDANLQAQLTGNVPLEASAFSPISWHSQVVSNSVTIPDNQNAWSFGPTMELGTGATVEVGANSFWTIANGEVTS